MRSDDQGCVTVTMVDLTKEPRFLGQPIVELYIWSAVHTSLECSLSTHSKIVIVEKIIWKWAKLYTRLSRDSDKLLLYIYIFFSIKSKLHMQIFSYKYVGEVRL